MRLTIVAYQADFNDATDTARLSQQHKPREG